MLQVDSVVERVEKVKVPTDAVVVVVVEVA
jgi:hypothetical protein